MSAGRATAGAIVVAAGRGERFGGTLPKVLVTWRGRTLLEHVLETFDACDGLGEVVLVASESVEAAWSAKGRPGKKVRSVVRGGETRQDSVAAGLSVLGADVEIVLVHDAARPFVTTGLIQAVIEAATRSGAALPLLDVHDTVKEVRRGAGGDVVTVTGTLSRDDLRLAQTPQGFRRGVLLDAHRHGAERGLKTTDDVSLVEAALASGAIPPGVRIEGVAGEETNVKVTRQADVPRARAEMRVGLGHDVHPLAPGRVFLLAGVDLQAGAPEAERKGPVGHSDGDAATHAICDALLGAVALGDIGVHFPDSRAENRGRSSLEFLRWTVERLRTDGWQVRNVSLVVRLERPAVQPHADAIRASLAGAMGMAVGCIGVSAKRGEAMGPVGEGRAVECDAVVLIERQA